MADTSKHKVPRSASEGKEEASTLKDKAKELIAGASEATRATADKMQELTATASDKTKELAAAASELTMHAKDKVQDWAATATAKTGDAVQDVGKELTGLVRRHPFPSLLIGFTIGFLLARATTRD